MEVSDKRRLIVIVNMLVAYIFSHAIIVNLLGFGDEVRDAAR